MDSKSNLEVAMTIHSKRLRGLLAGVFVLAMVVAWQGAWAQDVVHAVSGIVKHVDKDSKTVVVKAADGTEHTIKYTDQTVVKGAKDTGKGVEKGADDTGKGVEKGADDTGKGVEKGSVDTYLDARVGTKVTVKYTEKGGEKTAVGIKDASKATAKAVAQ